MTSFPLGSAQGAKLAVSEADWPLERVTAAARTGQARDDLARISPVVTAPGIQMPRDRKLTVVPKPDVDAGADKAHKRAGANPAMAPFGKRPVQRGKPRFLGLILTGILLLLLAAVAAWSSYLIASAFGEKEPAVAVAAGDAPATDAIVAAPLPIAAPETVAAAADPAPTVPQADPADFAVDPAPEAEPDVAAAALTGADAAADPEPVVEPATVAQPATSAVDGRNPVAEPQDEILLAMIDPDIRTSDAVALAIPGTATDPVPLSQPAPPPFGTLYQFDADGLIVPTPEGIITPEGVLLVAGPPPRIPPQRPEVPVPPVADAAGVTPEAAAVAEVAPVVYADPALADARPRLRPEDLVPSETATPDDGAELTTAPAGRLSSLKPRARPVGLLAAGDAALQAEPAQARLRRLRWAQRFGLPLLPALVAGAAAPLALAERLQLPHRDHKLLAQWLELRRRWQQQQQADAPWRVWGVAPWCQWLEAAGLSPEAVALELATGGVGPQLLPVPRRPLLRWWLRWRHLKAPCSAAELMAAEGLRPGPALGERLRQLRAERLAQERC
jgi:hypothetical protein